MFSGRENDHEKLSATAKKPTGVTVGSLLSAHNSALHHGCERGAVCTGWK